jgi:hypothetical protein
MLVRLQQSPYVAIIKRMGADQPDSKPKSTAQAGTSTDPVDDLFGSIQHTKHKASETHHGPGSTQGTPPLTTAPNAINKPGGLGKRVIAGLVIGGLAILALAFVIERYSKSKPDPQTAGQAAAEGSQSSPSGERKFQNPFTTLQPGSVSNAPAAASQPAELNLSHRKGDSRPMGGAHSNSDHSSHSGNSGSRDQDRENDARGDAGDANPNESEADGVDAAPPVQPQEGAESIPPGEG